MRQFFVFIIGFWVGYTARYTYRQWLMDRELEQMCREQGRKMHG